jgi:NAD(P)-dependent dehydrogenase (short-subunit alcohol dehydrogenase family)
MIDLANKNILITGASSGIGRQCAVTASRLGANVMLVARNMDRLKETKALMEKGNHFILSLDMTEIEKIPGIIEETFTMIGSVSGFVHSAGIEMTLPLKFMKKEHYDKLFLVNVISGFEFIKVLANKKYVNEKGASFVLLSSIMSSVGSPGKVGYCASKGAIVAGVKPMALELASKNIRINSISPGMVETDMAKSMFASMTDEAKKKIIDMHPLGLGKPEDIANLCMFLLSDSSKWITGTNMVIDGGYSAH